jgi:hypothetical protein
LAKQAEINEREDTVQYDASSKAPSISRAVMRNEPNDKTAKNSGSFHASTWAFNA